MNILHFFNRKGYPMTRLINTYISFCSNRNDNSKNKEGNDVNKLLMSLSVTMLFFLGSGISLTSNNIAHAQQKPIPPYAKWGTLALQKTQEKYPNAKIIDYLHIGRTTGPQSSIEKFKLWLEENNKEFGVFINIEFNNETEKVLKVTFEETSR
jgi:hypothetical protein